MVHATREGHLSGALYQVFESVEDVLPQEQHLTHARLTAQSRNLVLN